jgi:hypothetical protein
MRFYVVCYCETSISVTAVSNRGLRKIFGPESENVPIRFRIIYNEEYPDL